MEQQLTRSALIREARREIRAQKCPRHLRKDAWRTVMDLLCTIAGYLPDCWPSERTLAKKLDKAQPNVHRTIVRAREWGLLVTTPRPLENSWRVGQAYHLVCLSEPLKAAIIRYQFQTSLDIRKKSSSSKKTETGSPSGIPLGRATPGGQKDLMTRRPPDDDWSSPAIGEDPRAPLGEPIEISADPATYLARKFDAKWSRLVKRERELMGVRGSSRGMAIGYIRKVMLDTLSPDYVEAYMDAFMVAVADGGVTFKEGQFAFERFTAWWGREEVEDPAIAKENQALVDSVRERLRARADEPVVPFLDRPRYTS